MRKSKCPKTMSGKHIWVDDAWNLLTGERSGSIEYTFPYKYIRCLACDVINDLKEDEKE